MEAHSLSNGRCLPLSSFYSMNIVNNTISRLVKSDMMQFIAINFVVWIIFLFTIQHIGAITVPVREGYLGPIPWANFDGEHYIGIASRGYVQFEEAFFPIYPYLIRTLGNYFGGNFALAGLSISYVSFFLVLLMLWKMVDFIPHIPKKNIDDVRRWTMLFTLYFPTAFYFGSVYTESLFMLFSVGAFYLLAKNHKVMFGIFASVASGIRLVGAFMLVPIGLFLYMVSLYRRTGDALLFMHVQPAFGANRSGGELVILPQVFWRYFNIFITVPLSNYDWWIALLEFVLFIFALIMIWLAWRRKFPKEWIYFSLAAVVLPTLTGTLSSIPRYILVAFPLFMILAMQKKIVRLIFFLISISLSVTLILLFTRGYWVA